MKKTRKANRKLVAMLLVMVMIAMSIPQGMQAYAAEAVANVQDTAETGEGDAGEEVQESAFGNEEAAVEDSVTATTEKTDAKNEEASENSFSSEETPTGSAGSEAANENGSDEVMTEEAASAEEISSKELSFEEASSVEEESETELATDEDSLKTAARNASTAKASGFSRVGGWNESIYAEITGIADTDVTEVRYSGAADGEFSEEDLNYLVRENGNGVRIDVLGLKAGTYTLTVKVGQESVLTESGIQVYAYDRSGFAHFKYSDGVGAYKDDGTLKDNAVVLYVTDKNKNDVELTVGNITVKGIGNILNSVGQDAGGGKTSNGGKANTNQGIIKELAKAGRPLVVRFIGTVSDSGLYKQSTFSADSSCLIEGLTAYNSVHNGGSVGDNGHMARIQSGKDITLEGIGTDAVIDGWGFHYIAQTSEQKFGKSFEVRNLTFINTPEDAIGMEGQQSGKDASSDITASVERCWVHHNEFYCPHIDAPAESDKSEGDGSVDFKRGQYFTCSYNYFDSCHKTNLVGSADYSLQYNLTYHHNYWYMCKARGPLTRRANVHMYNNVWDMQTDYAQNTRADAYIFSEYNIFYACKSPQAVESGAIKSYHDTISSAIWNKGSQGTVVTDKAEYVQNNCQFSARGIRYDKFDTDSSQSYIPSNDYQLQTDFAQMRKTIVSQTGVQDQDPKRPEAVSKSEYSVIGRMAGSNIHTIDSLPQTLTPGKISKSVYAFEVGADFDLEIAYEDAANAPGVLVNEEGENLLTGDGSAVELPAGRYMIQAQNFQPGDPNRGTIAVFKGITIGSLKISQHDPNAHYHKWRLDSSKSTAATCTEAGKNVYYCEGKGTCGENSREKEETVPALGHAYGAWQVTKEATETEDGMKRRYCTRCKDAYEDAVIPKGSSGSGDGDSGGGSTVAGDYELYFTGRKINGDTSFFTVTNGNYKTVDNPVTVNGIPYTDGLKMESDTEVSFSSNDESVLFMAFDTNAKRVKVDGQVKTTDENGVVQVELSKGLHNITKGDSMNLFYVSVVNGASEEVYYTLSFEYNYDDSPDAKTIQAIEGKTYASMSELAPSSLTRTGYKICGLYLDTGCAKPVAYPYVVNADATFYADWEKSKDEAAYYTVILDTDGGTLIDGGARERIVLANTEIDPGKCEKKGYVFKGWTVDGKDINLPYTVTGDVLLKARYAPDREGVCIVGLEDAYDYTGAKIIPNIGVMDYDVSGGKLLAPGVDYTVQYKDNVKPGTAIVVVTGKGNYAGKDAKRSFLIKEAGTAAELENLKGVKIAKISAVPYSGEELHPPFTLIKGNEQVQYAYDEKAQAYKAGGAAIKANVALSNNVNKGTATILISGAKDDKGKPTKVKGTFKITPIDLQANAASGKVTVAADAGIYAVKGAAPASVTVQYDGKTLLGGTDYTVKYSANKKAGQKGTLVITGKGNYTKKFSKEFDIAALNLENRQVEAVNAYDGIKAGKVTAIVTDEDGNALKPSQYTLLVYKNGKRCDAKEELKKDDVIYVEAVASDRQNLIGQTPQKMFTVGSNIAKAKITINKGTDGKTITKAYTGSPITLEEQDLTVKIKVDGKEETLHMGENKDFVIASYENNTNKGTATAVIQGVHSYSGTKKVKFKITGKTMTIKESVAWDDISDSVSKFMEGLFH